MSTTSAERHPAPGQAAVDEQYERVGGASDAGIRQELLREALLIPPAGWQRPALDGVAPGIRALPPVESTFRVGYYDTADHALTRAGITLRYRADAPTPPWTLKLPAAPSSSRLIRRTIRLPGSGDAVPAEALDLVRARTRGRPIHLAAELATRRTVVTLCDRSGTALVDVVDDDVEAAVAGAAPGRLREVKVDVKELDRTGGQLLDAITLALESGGCRRALPASKLSRALGTDPDVLAREIDAREPAATTVGQILARSYEQLLAYDGQLRFGGDVEDVHDYRTAVQRLRAHLGTFAEMLDPAWVRRLLDELRWLGSIVGAARDADVLRLVLTDHLRYDLPADDRAAGRRLRSQLERRREDAEHAMMSALRSSRYDALLDALDDACRHPRLQASAPARQIAALPIGELMTHLMQRASRRLGAAARRGGPEPTDLQLRRIRAAAKRCRFVAEAALPVVGDSAARVAESVAGVQQLLGRHRDAVAAEAWLRTAAQESVDDAIAAGELIAALRRDRERVRVRWTGKWP